MSHSTMLSKYGNCTRLLKIKKTEGENRLFLQKKKKKKFGKNSRFVGVFNKTIIALALVGYEMIIANLELCA